MLKTGEMLKIVFCYNGKLVKFDSKGFKNTIKMGISAYMFQKSAPDCSQNAIFQIYCIEKVQRKGISVNIFRGDKIHFFLAKHGEEKGSENKVRPYGYMSAIYLFLFCWFMFLGPKRVRGCSKKGAGML